MALSSWHLASDVRNVQAQPTKIGMHPHHSAFSPDTVLVWYGSPAGSQSGNSFTENNSTHNFARSQADQGDDCNSGTFGIATSPPHSPPHSPRPQRPSLEGLSRRSSRDASAFAPVRDGATESSEPDAYAMASLPVGCLVSLPSCVLHRDESTHAFLPAPNPGALLAASLATPDAAATLNPFPLDQQSSAITAAQPSAPSIEEAQLEHEALELLRPCAAPRLPLEPTALLVGPASAAAAPLIAAFPDGGISALKPRFARSVGLAMIDDDENDRDNDCDQFGGAGSASQDDAALYDACSVPRYRACIYGYLASTPTVAGADSTGSGAACGVAHGYMHAPAAGASARPGAVLSAAVAAAPVKGLGSNEPDQDAGGSLRHCNVWDAPKRPSSARAALLMSPNLASTDRRLELEHMKRSSVVGSRVGGEARVDGASRGLRACQPGYLACETAEQQTAESGMGSWPVAPFKTQRLEWTASAGSIAADSCSKLSLAVGLTSLLEFSAAEEGGPEELQARAAEVLGPSGRGGRSLWSRARSSTWRVVACFGRQE